MVSVKRVFCERRWNVIRCNLFFPFVRDENPALYNFRGIEIPGN
jgi:hypothetical protein